MAERFDLDGVTVAWAALSLPALQEVESSWRTRLASGEASSSRTFRDYVEGLCAMPPATVKWAHGLVVAAVATPTRLARFRRGEDFVDLPIPPGYGAAPRSCDEVRGALLGRLGAIRLDATENAPLKLCAVWSGLGRYGRNNIVNVEGLGTAITLMGYWSESMPEGVASGPRFLDRCAECRRCADACPTGAIPPHLGCIDAGLCVPLYNEVEGEFPGWLPKESHNAAVGCLRCQLACPENAPFRERRVVVGPFDEAMLDLLLGGRKSPALDGLIEAMLGRGGEDVIDAYRPVFARNVAALLGARESV